MKATLAPTPAKMAREMLAADRRAQKRRHRARRARKVHTPPLIRPETLEPGIYSTLRIEEARRQAFFGHPSAQPSEAASGAAANRRSCGAAYLPRSERTVHRSPFAVHASKASSLCDLLLAAILWGLALICVGLTIAIAVGIALHLFSR